MEIENGDVPKIENQRVSKISENRRSAKIEKRESVENQFNINEINDVNPPAQRAWLGVTPRKSLKIKENRGNSTNRKQIENGDVPKIENL